MADDEIDRMYYECARDGSSVRFYDAKGAKHGDSTWAINGPGGDLMIEVDPDSMLPGIRDLIAGNIAEGNEAELAMVLFGPRQGVVLFLEGVLTPAHLGEAWQGIDHVEIHGVKIDDRTFTVRIMKDATYYGIATANSEGFII